MPGDLDFQNLSTVQSKVQPGPATLAAAATIAPTTFMTLITGTTAIVNVTPPVTGSHMLVLIPGAAFTMTTAGNLLTAITAAINAPVLLFYNPALGKYYVGEAVGS